MSRTRDTVLKNTARLNAAANREIPIDLYLSLSLLLIGNHSLIRNREIADQGFTRPKVLILLPLRHSAKLFVTTLLRLVPSVQKVLLCMCVYVCVCMCVCIYIYIYIYIYNREREREREREKDYTINYH